MMILNLTKQHIRKLITPLSSENTFNSQARSYGGHWGATDPPKAVLAPQELFGKCSIYLVDVNLL